MFSIRNGVVINLCYNLVESIEFDSVVLVSVMGSVDALDQL